MKFGVNDEKWTTTGIYTSMFSLNLHYVVNCLYNDGVTQELLRTNTNMTTSVKQYCQPETQMKFLHYCIAEQATSRFKKQTYE